MGESNIRNYQVNYAINAQGNAPEYFLKMAENTEKMMQPLNNLQSQINAINRSLRILGQNENLKNLFALKPTLDISALKTSLAEAEKLVEASADRMAAKLNTALASAAASKSSAKIKSAKALDESAIKAQMEKLEKDFLLASGGKAMSKVKGRDDTTASAWSIREDYNKLKKRLADMQTKMTKTSSNIIGSVKKAEDIEKTATAINNLNAAVKGFNNRKAIKVKIDADASKAIATFNAFLKQVQDTVVSLPLAIETAANKSKKGKGKTGTKTSGTAIPATPESVANLIKGKEKTITVTGQFNEGNLVAQLTTSLGKLQELATSKPVIVRSVFNGGDAAFQLHQSIVNLQKLADTKPIILKATTTATTPAPNDGTVAPVTTTTTKDGKGTTQTSATKWTNATQSQINAYERHRQAMSDMRINSAVDLIKQKSKMQAATHAANQTMYDQLFGREAMHQKWIERDAAGESTRAKRNAAREAISSRAALNAAQHNARELQRLRQLSLQSMPVVESEQVARNRYYSSGGGGRRYSVARPKDDLYTRSRAFWYPFTGNTSFGARTPMAVDMAKGMGTMFAIGGAMSAVGSSLNQAIEYQNIMKTTNAILKNGTDTYTSGGFKGMEQIVRQVGKDTKFTAPQVASAAKFLAMAGYDIPAINQAIKPVSNIALIGDTDLGATADKLTNVMTTFGIAPAKMGEIADIMTTTFTRSNTDMMMLAESAKYAGGIANLYGGSFKNNFADVMAMFGVLGNAGIQASSAGTTLRMMYQNLMQPNKNQRATLKQYGIYTRDTKGNPLEMIDILKQINAKVPKAQLADAIGNMFRITAQPGAAALATHLDGSNGLIALMQANRTSAGSGISESIANEKKNTMAGLWAQVQSTFTEGVLQAFEGKEGGWAGMLVQLRDYLAQPETVEMLRSIIDMVENLAKIMGNFAKIYAKVYNMFPDVFNFWIKAQLAFTQLGYLVTPAIQLIGVLSMLKTALIGTSAAATTATVVENTINKTRKASAAVSAASSIIPSVAKSSTGGLVAANIAAGMAQYQYFKPYYQLKGFTTRPDILGPLSMTRNRNAASLAEQAALASVSSQIALYERSRNYQWGGMTKTQKKQLNNTINRKIAELRAIKTGHIEIPSILPLNFGLYNKPIYQHGRQLTTGSYLRAGASQVMPFNKYSGNVSAVLYGATPVAENATKYGLLSQKWRDASTFKNISDAQRAMANQRADAYLNAAILASQMQQQKELAEKAAIQSAAIKRQGEIKNIALARHASRGVVASDVRERYAKMYGWKAGAKMTWGTSFKAGQALGTLSLASMVGSIKSMALSLFSGLAKAIGMLTSPIGLAVSLLTLLGAGIYKVYKDAKERQAQLDLIKQNANWADEHNRKIKQMYMETGIDIGGFKPVNVGYAKAIDKNESQSYTINDDNIAKLLLDKDSVSKLTGSQIIKGYVQKSNYLPKELLTDYYRNNTDYKIYRSDLWSSKKVNKDSQNNALKLGIIARWADLASEQEDVKQASHDLQKAMYDKDFKRAQDIINAYKPTSMQRMSQMSNANAISQITDPTKFYEWQYAQYKVLTDLQSNYMGPLQNYQKAMDIIADLKGMKKSERQDYDATNLAQTIISAIPISFNGTTAQITLDKMGKVDWTALANSVNNGIPFTIGEQQDILRNTYDAIYNDPNIKNFASVIDLLQTYLPQIANARSPYDEGHWTNWEFGYTDNKQNNEELQVPLRPKPTTFTPFKWEPLIKVPTYVSDLDEAFENTKDAKGKINFIAGTSQYIQTHQDIFPNVADTTAKTTTNKYTRNGIIGGTNSNGKNSQKDYRNTYDRSTAKPTQVVINIDKLANFDRTAIAKNADERAIIETIENKIAEAIAMLSSQALNSASSLIAQGM